MCLRLGPSCSITLPGTRAAVACVLAGAASGTPLSAQWAASVDAGPAYVTYEGYLGSSAVTLAPATTWAAHNASIAARGALTRFETGHTSLAGDVAAAWYNPVTDALSIGITGDGTVSHYQLASPAVRGRLGLRAQSNAPTVAWWGGGSVGALHQGGPSTSLAELNAGGAVRLQSGILIASAAVHWLGGVPFEEGEAVVRIVRGPLTVGATGGARASHDLSGRRQWAHGDLAFQITPHVSATLGGGSYPSDPTVNAPGAQYAAAGLRLAWGGPERRRLGPIRLPGPPSRVLVTEEITPPPENSDSTASTSRHPHAAPPSVEIDAAPGHRIVFHVHAPDAKTVEVIGDFTGWGAVPLAPSADDGWVARFAVAPGIHRVEVRIDHGPWRAPTGITWQRDDFGGTVGVFVSP